ncbi:MAG: hypothetical protein KJ718_03475 [Nanoarchaeota archaeon]|nr:hypothetical protein [Nanoarchaeota archaeon]
MAKPEESCNHRQMLRRKGDYCGKCGVDLRRPIHLEAFIAIKIYTDSKLIKIILDHLRGLDRRGQHHVETEIITSGRAIFDYLKEIEPGEEHTVTGRFEGIKKVRDYNVAQNCGELHFMTFIRTADTLIQRIAEASYLSNRCRIHIMSYSPRLLSARDLTDLFPYGDRRITHL